MDRKTAQLALHFHRTQCDGLEMFRPLRHELKEHSQEEFFKCMATQIAAGGSNQAGKTVTCSARFAAFARDKPITFLDGSQWHMRKPIHRGQQVLMWLVGIQLNHIGATLYPKLFLPGAIKLIRDEKTRAIRAWLPSNEYDLAYKEKAFDAPPFIPQSEIDGKIAWRRRAQEELESVRLKNGTSIRAYASTAEAKQGDQVHYLWIDEAIDNSRHYNEWMARIGPVEGQIVWSGWYDTDPTEAFEKLIELAEQDKDKSYQRAARFSFLQRDNPFYPKNMTAELESTGQWDDEEAAARIGGVWLGNKRRVFPNFTRRIHTLMTFSPEPDDLVQLEVRKKNQIPADWTRYLVLDPGVNHPAVLMAAVPPPELGDAIVPYDELYPGRIESPDELARLILMKTKGQKFELFVIDNMAGRQRTMGALDTVESIYRKAFARYRLSCRRMGSGFMPGSPDRLSRIALVQDWLNIQPNGRPTLRIWHERCPNLVSQMERYKFKLDPRTKKPTNDPEDRFQQDLCVTVQYLASVHPRYVGNISGNSVNSVEALLAGEYPRNPYQSRESVNVGPVA